MDSVTYPYKLQVFLPGDLRKRLKMLANAKDTSLQKLVVAILTAGTDADVTDMHTRIDTYLGQQD